MDNSDRQNAAIPRNTLRFYTVVGMMLMAAIVFGIVGFVYRSPIMLFTAVMAASFGVYSYRYHITTLKEAGYSVE